MLESHLSDTARAHLASSSPSDSTLYPFFTTSQTAFLNFTCSFKVLCRLLPYLHPSITYQVTTHLACIYRNVFVPLSNYVEGVRQDIFAKEFEEVAKTFETRLLQSLIDSPVYLALPNSKEEFTHLSHDAMPNTSEIGEKISLCAWNFAASQEPIMSLYPAKMGALRDSGPAAAAKEGSTSAFMQDETICFASGERVPEDYIVELNAIRAMAGLDSRILERRLNAINLLWDACRDAAGVVNNELERRRYLNEYQTNYQKWQADMEVYKKEVARRQNLQFEAGGVDALQRLLPLVPPRKPDHPFEEPTSTSVHAQYAYQARQQAYGQILQYNAVTHPFHFGLPGFVSHHSLTIISSVFGPKAHVALIPKAKDLLGFFAQQDILTEEHLDYIWQSHLSKHISIVHLVWEAFALLAPFLSSPLLEHLFLLIQRDLTPNMISKEMINLIKAVTSVALQQQDSIFVEEMERITNEADASKAQLFQQYQQQLRSKGSSSSKSTDAADQGAGAEAMEIEIDDETSSVDPQLEEQCLQAQLNVDTLAAQRMYVVQHQPRKLYGLWTMMRVLTDGDVLSAQATPALIKDTVETFFKSLFEWGPCSPFRAHFLIFLLHRIQHNQSTAQSILLFNSILETYLPHKQYIQYSPEARSEFAQLPPLAAEHLQLAIQTLANTPGLLVDLSASATNDLVTTHGLALWLPVPFLSQQMAVTTVVNWLETHFQLQSIIISAMTNYKATVLHLEAGVKREDFMASIENASVASDASVGSVPSQYVIQSIANKKLEERRNEGFIPVESTSQGNTTTTSSPAPSSRYLKASPFSYTEHIDIRLRAMVLTSHSCEVKRLGRPELDQWWVLLMRWCLTKKEMKMMSEHWTSLLFNYATNHFPVTDKDMDYLFNKLAAELDVTEATKTELDLIKAFIIFFAWRREQYVPLPPKDHAAYPYGFYIRGDILQIPGLHLFWKIATQTKDPKSAEAANSIIVSFYEYPAPDADKSHFQKAFVMNAVEILKTNYELISSSGSKAAASHFTPISRCLTLIRKVLSSSVNRASPTTRGMPIKLTLKPLTTQLVEINLFFNDPISVVRAKAAEVLKTVPQEVRLIITGKELKIESDHIAISQSTQISAGSTIHIIKKPQSSGQNAAEATPGEAAPPQISVIAMLLSTEPYFSLFFNVLLVASSQNNNDLAKQVWDLLMELPHNRELMNGLDSIRAADATMQGIEGTPDAAGTAPDWNVLLDPTNSFKLFYSLQIVESLLRPRDGPTATTERWDRAFESTGGVLHLVRLLLTAPLTNASQGFKRFPAASLILDLLTTYLTRNAPVPSPEATKVYSSNSVVIPPAAIFSMLSAESLARDVLSAEELKLSPEERTALLVSKLAKRLLDLGLASIIDESDLLHQEDDEGRQAIASPTPSTQEEQDDTNAAATITPSVQKQTDDSGPSNSEVLLSHIWPFMLSISNHSAQTMRSSVLSASMKPTWHKLMQVVFLSKVHLDRVRSSLSSAITSLLIVSSGVDSYEMVQPTDGGSYIMTNKSLIFFADLAYSLFTPSTLPAGLPYCHEFFGLLNSMSRQLFEDMRTTTAPTTDIIPIFVKQQVHTDRLLTHDAVLKGFAERLYQAVTAVSLVLSTYPVIEKRGDASLKDVYLIGLLDFIKSCLELFPSWVFTHPAIFSGGSKPSLEDNPLDSKLEEEKATNGSIAFSIASSIGNLLFRISSPTNSAGALSPPACKTSESRSAAFSLLLTLTNPLLSTHFDTLTKQSALEKLPNPMVHISCLLNDFILPRHIGRGNIGNGIKSWAYQPLGMEKAACGYVGLRNLAATCYMNSLMQQFYMLPQFRSRIFSLTPFVKTEGEPEKKDALLDSRNVLFQLQNLFAHLQESQQKYYDPTSFTKVYKGPDGRVMNPIVQMDAEEFFAGLLDKIESVIKGTQDEKAVREFFGGTLLQQVHAKDCGHISKREEDMLTIPVEVKGKSNLYESLEAFVKADILDGDNKYQCSQCNQMVDARKFSSLGRLPDNLVFSLKRFDFDFEALMRVKVNDYFEFPMTLSVEPFTEEGLRRKEKADAKKAQQETSSAPAENAVAAEPQAANSSAMDLDDSHSFDPTDYTYTLSGIVIHRGTADSGHYYSYIKDRNSSPDKPKWYLFNDMSVESFDESYIPPLAFGGDDDSRRGKKSYSAYMLFYTKNKPSHPYTQAKLDETTLSEAVPRDLFASTWVDNTSFLLDQQIYEKQYLEFLGALVQKGDELVSNTPPSLAQGSNREISDINGSSNKMDVDDKSSTLVSDLEMIALTRLNWTVITETLLQMRVKTWFATHMSALSSMVRDSVMAAKTIIAELSANTPQSVGTLMKIFVECPVNDLKQQFSTLVAEALITCINQSLVDDTYGSSIGKQASDAKGAYASLSAVERSFLPERGEDSPEFSEPFSVHIRHFIDVWMTTILDYSKQDVSNEDRRSHVTSVINSVANVLALALEQQSSRTAMVSHMVPFVHVIMEIIEKMPGPEDEESRKKLKDWRKAFKPLVNIVATIVTSSNPATIPPPTYIVDLSLRDTVKDAKELTQYQEQTLAWLPSELSDLQTSTKNPELLSLPLEAWSYLLSNSFLTTLLDDPGLASSVNTSTLKIMSWLADHHPAWARHLLHLCLTRMSEVGYERYENIVVLLPTLFASVRRVRQISWDALDDVRQHLIQALARKHMNLSTPESVQAKLADDRKWGFILFPAMSSPQPTENFLDDYILADTQEVALETKPGQEGKDAWNMLALTPNFSASSLDELSKLIDTPKWSLKTGVKAGDNKLSPLRRLITFTKAEMLHSALAQWAVHKGFINVLLIKRALKLASYWALRCLLDCVENDFVVRQLIQLSKPIFDDFLPIFIIFEKDERVRAIAERFYQTVPLPIDIRRRIWKSTSDDDLFASCVSSSVLNSAILSLPTSVVPRRHLPSEIDPMWEEKDQTKNSIEIILCTTGILTLPDSTEIPKIEKDVLDDCKRLNVAMKEEQATNPRFADSQHPILSVAAMHPIQVVETLEYPSDLASMARMVETSTKVLERIWFSLVRVLKAITKADVTSPIDAAREKERLGAHELLFKYRLVQLLRLMTWVLVSVPHESKRALQQACFDECWTNIWMLWREGVGENFDFNRTALYAFVDVLSHRFTPILAALSQEASLTNMNIHVNIDKTVAVPIAKFNDRTSSHYFRIMLRTILYLDSEKRQQLGSSGYVSVFGDEVKGQSKTENGTSPAGFRFLSRPHSLLDTCVVQNNAASTDESYDATQNSLFSKLTSQQAWDWSMNWLFINGYERYPTLALFLEQLVLLWMKRFSRRDHLAIVTISNIEQLRVDMASPGASKLLLAATMGSLMPDYWLNQIQENASGTPSVAADRDSLADLLRPHSYALYGTPAEAERKTVDGLFLANPLDASNAFLNPYKSLGKSPYGQVTLEEDSNPNNAHGFTLTDWSISYSPLHPVSPLITLELPRDPLVARERVIAWMQDAWLLIEQRLVGVLLAHLLSTQASQHPLSGVLTSLLNHPMQSPNSSVQRSAVDLLQTLRLVTCWISPLYLALSSSGKAETATFSAFKETQLLARPLQPLQQIMFEIFQTDETLASTALDLVKWLAQHQFKDMERFTTLVLTYGVVRDQTATQYTSNESHAIRSSLLTTCFEILDALALISLTGPSASLAATNAKFQIPRLILSTLASSAHSYLSFIPFNNTPEKKEETTMDVDSAALSAVTIKRPLASSFSGLVQCTVGLSTSYAVLHQTTEEDAELTTSAAQIAFAALVSSVDSLVQRLPATFSIPPVALSAASMVANALEREGVSNLMVELGQKTHLSSLLKQLKVASPDLHYSLSQLIGKLL